MATIEDYGRLGNYAEMLNKDSNIDRHFCHRTVPMRVLSLGFSRTGTLSMQKAFYILGYRNPYHFSSTYSNVKDCDMWVEALNAKYKGIGKPFSRTEFDQLLGHVEATTDAPCTIFAVELMEAYPEAKVILVERDIERWYKSWETLLTAAFNPFIRFLAFTDPFWHGKIQRMGTLWIETQVRAKSLKEAQRTSRDVYREYYKMVREKCPKERLLEYELGSGWEPLCEFLGKPVPDVPFSRLNESQSLQKFFEAMGVKAIKNSLWNLMVAGSAIVAVVVAVRLAAARN